MATPAFISACEQGSYDPIFLVELLGVGRWYATREPEFSGLWKSGQGLIAGATVKSGDELPVYTTSLKRLQHDGIGAITQQLDPSGFARTGNSQVNFLGQGFVNHDLQPLLLENSPILIRLGFVGLPLSDYEPIFYGSIEQARATLDAFTLDSVDDTLRNLNPVPPVIGTDFLLRSFTRDVGIPIILGDVEFVPLIKTVGDVEATLAFNALTGAVSLTFFEVDAAFPPTGSVTIDAETLAYTRVYTTVVGAQTFGILELDTATTADHFAGVKFDLDNFNHKYLSSFAGRNPRRVRANTSAPTVKTEALDHRKIHVLEFADEQDDTTLTISGPARGRNLFRNGNFNSLTTDHWVTGTGTWDSIIPAAKYDPVLRGKTLVAQALQSDAYQEVAVVANNRYRLTFLVHNIDATFASITVGTPGDATKYYTFERIGPSSDERLFDLTFIPDESTVRVTLFIDNTGNAGVENFVYFDQFDIYDVTTENPAVQLTDLIQRHMPSIQVNATTMAEAQSQWAFSGDRCAGIIQEPEEEQALLGRIAQQFRAITYLNESSEQVFRVFDQSRQPTRSFRTRDILKGSLTVTKSPVAEIFTHYYVYYGRSPQVVSPTAQGNLGGVSSFAGIVQCTPTGTNLTREEGLYVLCEGARNRFRKEQAMEIFGDFIPDRRTAENTLAYHVRRGTHQRYIASFTTFLQGSWLPIWEFISITHPLLPEEVNGSRFQILSKTVSPNGCTVEIVAESINPFSFGAYVEHWEPPTRLKITRTAEHWEKVQALQLVDKLCNPYTEHWEVPELQYSMNLQRWDESSFYDTLQAAASFIPSISEGFIYGNTTFVGLTFNGVPMFPTFYSAQDGGAPDFAGERTIATYAFATPPRKIPSDYSTGGATVTKGTWAVNADSVTLDPAKGTYLSIADAARASGTFGCFGMQSSVLSEFSAIRMSHDLSFRLLVKLASKSTSMPIWCNDLMTFTTPLTGDIEIKNGLSLWYDKTSDRFVVTAGNHEIDGMLGDGSLDLMTERVVGNSTGSPAIGQWYDIVFTWQRSSSSASIQVNGGTRDTAVISPAFDVDAVSGWSSAVGGSFVSKNGNRIAEFNPDTAELIADNGDSRLTLNGEVGLWAFWGRLLTSSEAVSLYNAGNPVVLR